MNLVTTHSNCTSPMDYISHHALHSHIPVHHYTNHTAVTIHSSLWLPHHTCTSFTHSHKSSTQTLTQCEVLFCPGYISERSSPYLLSLCVTPDCLTLDFWTCACDLDPCLVLFTSLLCLRYSCYALWPLPVWFCLCPINLYYCTWIPCLWPVFTEDFASSDPAASSPLPSSTMDSISLLLHLRQGGLTMEEYVHQFCELSYQVPLYDEYLFKDLFISDSLVRSRPGLTNLCFLEECIMGVWGAFWTMLYRVLALPSLWVF